MAPKNEKLDDTGWPMGSVKDSFDQGSKSKSKGKHATERPMVEGTFEIGDKFRTAKKKDIHFRWMVTSKDLSRYEMTKERVETELKPTGPVSPDDLSDNIDWWDALGLPAGPIGPGKIKRVTQFELEFGAWIQEGDQVVYDMDSQVIGVGRAIVDTGTGDGGHVVRSSATPGSLGRTRKPSSG